MCVCMYVCPPHLNSLDFSRAVVLNWADKIDLELQNLMKVTQNEKTRPRTNLVIAERFDLTQDLGCAVRRVGCAVCAYCNDKIIFNIKQMAVCCSVGWALARVTVGASLSTLIKPLYAFCTTATSIHVMAVLRKR